MMWENEGKRLSVLAVCGTLIGMGGSWFASGYLVRPLAQMRDAIGMIARGDLRAKVVFNSARDEVGQTITLLSQTTKQLHEMVGAIQSSSPSIAWSFIIFI